MNITKSVGNCHSTYGRKNALREWSKNLSYSLTYSTILQAPSFIELYLMNNYMEFNNFSNVINVN